MRQLSGYVTVCSQHFFLPAGNVWLMGLLRAKIRWTIPGAGTAFSVLHFGTEDASTPTQADADEAVARVQAYATAIKAYLPNQVTLQVLNELEEIVVTTGNMLGVYTTASQTAQTGTAGATVGWAAPAGAVITWNTAGVKNSRRVRGRTFIVPLANSAYETDGTIGPTALTGLNTAATNLRTSGTETTLAVYCRPTGPGLSDGQQHEVLSHRIPDMCAMLTSRRS